MKVTAGKMLYYLGIFTICALAVRIYVVAEKSQVIITPPPSR